MIFKHLRMDKNSYDDYNFDELKDSLEKIDFKNLGDQEKIYNTFLCFLVCNNVFPVDD